MNPRAAVTNKRRNDDADAMSGSDDQPLNCWLAISTLPSRLLLKESVDGKFKIARRFERQDNPSNYCNNTGMYMATE
jgi:hypothetical protein